MKKASQIVVVCLTLAFVLAWVAPAFAAEMAKVNLNTATKEQLQTLPGIGESYADRIIEYRKTNGPFKSPEDIMKVKGIGDKAYQQIKNQIVVAKPE